MFKFLTCTADTKAFSTAATIDATPRRTFFSEKWKYFHLWFFNIIFRMINVSLFCCMEFLIQSKFWHGQMGLFWFSIYYYLDFKLFRMALMARSLHNRTFGDKKLIRIIKNHKISKCDRDFCRIKIILLPYYL